ncbi:MAG: PDZ domain-containing protein [Kamptonema sp. SIO1D9]|nr:PDZ domain-containing protein [Kamptonema sp. SIO1D9]
MKKSTKKISPMDRLLCGSAIAALSTVSVLAPGMSPSASAALEDSPKTVVDEVWQIVNNEYVDRSFNSVDWQAKRQELLSKNYPSKEQAYNAIRAALREIGDPYTRFLDPAQFEALSSRTFGELSGVGIRMEIDKKTKILTVVEPIENSPATQADIRPGDQILEIDGKVTAKMTVEEASELIRGETGTEVRLKMARGGSKIFDVILTRVQIELPAVRYTLKEEGNKRVGYIKLEEFTSHAAEQMERAIVKLNNDKVEAFVLDLRGNPGGLLFASVDIARMWMETGTIVRTVDRKGGDRQFAANRTALTNLPLVVLVDEYSASASEILAGALKDSGRATIVGNRTYGKGAVQSVHTLSDGSGLVVTISRYYLPSGADINKRGITPDIQLGLTAEQQLRLTSDPSLVGTGHDPQYARAISVLSRR